MSDRAFPDLNNVRFFAEVVAAGSFSAAARAFDLPPSTVSRRVGRLEQELGVRLLQRTTRSLRLTDAGRTYLEYARRALTELGVAQRRVREVAETPRGKVRLTAPVGLGEILCSLFARFLAHHTDVRMEVDLTDRYLDLVEEGYDLALRSSREGTSALVGRRLSSSMRELFASPGYLAVRGTPRSLKHVAEHDCVIQGSRSERAAWTLVSGKTRRKVTVRGRIAVNEARIAARAAASGLGIALLPRALATPFLRSGELKQVLPRVTGGIASVFIVYPNRRLTAAARALADFLASELPAALPATHAAADS